MTNVNDGSPASNSQKSSEGAENQGRENQLSADELKARYDKILEENKRYRERASQAESKLEELDKRTLEEQGKYKELAEQFKAKYEETRKALDTTKATFGTNAVFSQVKLEAQKIGCKDVDLLLSHYKKDIQTSVMHDDSFTVDSSSVVDFLNKAKKEKPLLFEKESPKFNDGIPNGKGVGGKKDISQLSQNELESELAKLLRP